MFERLQIKIYQKTFGLCSIIIANKHHSYHRTQRAPLHNTKSPPKNIPSHIEIKNSYVHPRLITHTDNEEKNAYFHLSDSEILRSI